MQRSILFATCAVALATASCKTKVAPEPEFVEPVLTLETDGYYHGSDVDVEGQAKGLSRLSVNGEELADGETFATEVDLQRGVNLIEVRGTDMRGDTHYLRKGVLSGDWEDPDRTVEDALTVRVNRGGLDRIGVLASELVVAQDIEASMMALNPLYQDHYGVFGLSAVDIAASLTALEFDPMLVDMDPRSGLLDLEVVIPNLLVSVNAVGEVVFIDFDQDVTLTATSAVVTGQVMADVSNRGELSMELVNPDVMLNGFTYDVSLLPSLIEDNLFVDSIREMIENTLISQVEQRVPDLVASQLEGLDFSFQTELLGKNVGVAATIDSLDVDPDGIQLRTHLDVLADGDPVEAPGYLFAHSSNEPHPSRNHDLGMAVSDNLLNNVLFKVWASGLLSLDLDSAEGEIEPFLLSSLGATNAARVVVEAPAPPVFVERNGGAQAQITELFVRIETPNGDNGEYLEASVTAFIDLELVIEDNVLALDIGEPELVIDVRDSDWGIDENTLSDLLAENLPINSLLAILGAIEFPLPELAGISISTAQAARDTSGVHTTIEATL